MEHLYNPIPNRLALKQFLHWDAFKVPCFCAVEMMDDIPQLLNMRHAEAFNKSATVQKLGVTPAAIAGVQRSVL
jgi:hypothetical protein